MSDNRLITVSLPEESFYWRPDPFPGSEWAIKQGCSCPTTQPWPGKLIFSADCTVHELLKYLNQ